MYYFDSTSQTDFKPKFAVYHSHPSHAPPTVEYHILHSTIYGVPVLYFFLHNIPYLMARNIDTVYQKLVPKQLRSELRSVSVLGGISMTVSNLTSLLSAIGNASIYKTIAESPYNGRSMFLGAPLQLE